MRNLLDVFFECRRRNAVLDKLHELGIERPDDVRYIFPLLEGVKLTFPNGETWEVSKVAAFLAMVQPHPAVAEYCDSYRIRVDKYSFRGTTPGGGQMHTIYNTALRPGRLAAAVICLYQEQLDRELYFGAAEAPICNALAKWLLTRT